MLKVNVMGYDYTGYGCSAGEMPSVGHTLSDITAVYDYLVNVSPLGIGIVSISTSGMSCWS